MFDDRVDEFLGMVGRGLVLVVASAAMLMLCGVALKPLLPLGLPMGDPGRILFAMMLSLSLVVGHLVVIVALERSRWNVAGLALEGWRPLTMLGGVGLGLVVVGVPGGLLLFTDQLTLGPGIAGSWGRFALVALLPTGVFSLAEELCFRGYVLGLLAQRWGAIAAVSLTSLLFAAAHLLSSSAIPVGIASIVVLGVFLGVLRLRTESLATAWLAHFALSWTQVALFHAPVAWIEPVAEPRYRMTDAGPSWLTGGTLGIEGGVAAAATAILLTVLVFRIWSPPERPRHR